MGITHSNVLGAFEVCLELSSDSKDQFSFEADEFCELVHILLKSLCSRLFVTRSARPARSASQKHAEFDTIFHSNVVGVFEVCLKLPSDLKYLFGFVAGEFSELKHTRKSLAYLIPV